LRRVAFGEGLRGPDSRRQRDYWQYF
jgi:hypothetical protein